MLLFHFIVTEMKEDTVNSNAMYMVEIENLYASRNDMLISIFLNLFYCNLSPITKHIRFKYGRMESHH